MKAIFSSRRIENFCESSRKPFRRLRVADSNGFPQSNPQPPNVRFNAHDKTPQPFGVLGIPRLRSCGYSDPCCFDEPLDTVVL